jgi:hypothetical protein
VAAAFTATTGAQSHGSVACPSGTSVLGGGVDVGSVDLRANVAGDYPSSDGSTWSADVNNSSGTDSPFQVYAECATTPAGYAIVESTSPSPTGAQSWRPMTCPKATVAFGGGFSSNLVSLAVNVAGDAPLTAHGRGISEWIDNGSGVDGTISGYVICGRKPSGYHIMYGVQVSVPASTQVSQSVACPKSSVPIGGGVDSSSDPAVTMNSTEPTTGGWTGRVNNASAGAVVMDPFAICAGT